MRRPGAPQWAPLSGTPLSGTPQSGTPQSGTPLVASGGGSSFRDLLGPVDAAGPSWPALHPVEPVPAEPVPAEPVPVDPVPVEPVPAEPVPVDLAPVGPPPAVDVPAPLPSARLRRRRPAMRGRRRLAVPGRLNSRWALAAVGVVAIGAGLGGAAVTGRGPQQGVAEPTTPEQCQAIQAAWTASASHQVGMSADDPVTLREGFMGARDALVDAPTPSGVADDWALVTHYLDTVAAAVTPVAPTDGEAIASAVGATLAELDTPEVTAASARITAYLTGGCAN